jgi:hypothetical protein
MTEEVFAAPLDADGRSGVVVIELPSGVRIRLTAEAAEQTSLRLLEAATLARMPSRYR